MAIKITCPGCKSTLTLADELRGKKVRCKKCETAVKVPDAAETAVKVPDANVGKRKRAAEEEVPQKSNASASDDDTDEDEEDRPKKKKKKKSQKGISPVMILAPVFVLILLIVGGVSAFFLTRDSGPAKQPPPIAKVEPKQDEEVQKPQIFAKIQDGNPAKKGGTGIVSSIRGAVYRAERKVELANINKMYTAFILETPNRSQVTLENYLNYIKRDYRPVHDAIKEGYYIMNMKAQGGNDIVAGERDLDHAGHLVVFYSGSVEYVPEAEWKKTIGIK